MPVKSILVPMTGTAADRAALDLALALARPAAAHVGAVYPRQDPRQALAYIGLGTSGDMMAIGSLMDQLEREGRDGSARARQTWEQWRAAAGLAEADRPAAGDHVTVGWREELGSPDELVAAAAARADLAVCGGLQPVPGLELELLESAIFGGARPVVVAPPGGFVDPFRCAVIAWNGTHEANRAVAAALGWLPRFAEVHVFCRAESHRAPVDPAAVLELLGWHGIAAQVLTSSASGEHLGADLLQQAAARGASMLVMGAYTHGRVRQMMFGGVTHHVLHHAALPVLLAH